jgi:hypothetical protein
MQLQRVVSCRGSGYPHNVHENIHLQLMLTLEIPDNIIGMAFADASRGKGITDRNRNLTAHS